MLLNIILTISTIFSSIGFWIIFYICIKQQKKIKYYNDNLPEISRIYQSFLKKDRI